MPNGGLTPGCLHCKWFTMAARKCTRHDFKFGVSLPRLICADLIDANEDYEWVKKSVDLPSLEANIVYIWLEIHFSDSQGNHFHKFDLYPIALLKHYATWSEDEEALMISEMNEASKMVYRKLGYKIE